MAILKSVFDVVKRAHGKEVAFLDLAMVLLEEGRTDRALKLLEVGVFVQSIDLGCTAAPNTSFVA